MFEHGSTIVDTCHDLSLPKHPSLRVLCTTAVIAAMIGAGCFVFQKSEGGGQTDFEGPRKVDPNDVAVPEGYRVEVVATGLTFPTDVTFDASGGIYVTEAGYSYGDYEGTPKLVRINPNGPHQVVATGKHPPWTGVEYHDGGFYVAGGHLGPGRIVRISPQGNIEVLVDGLPSFGDHHTNGPAIGADGWVYFGQGTATNSAVVDTSNFKFGWPKRHPDFHDIPCKDIVLAGKNFKMPNELTKEPDDEVQTGTFVPFGQTVKEGQVIPGELPCSGAVMRVRPDGSNLELVAWGLRNPFGLAFSPGGELYITENQFDVRGERPIFGTGDLLWRVEPGTWYGWPDFWAGRPLTDDGWFEAPGKEQPEFVLAEHPQTPPKPAAIFGVHSSSNGLDFSSSPEFGHVGKAFVAQFGDMASAVGKVLEPVGYKVVIVDADTGVIHDFMVNRGETNGPASWLKTQGLERPVSAAFNPKGDALYVVDFGVMTIRDAKIMPQPGTGVLWRVVVDQNAQGGQ